MRILRWVFVCLLVASAGSLSGQYTKEFKRIYFDASYLFETGFYEEALKRYNNLLALDPGNCNILFHCGVCCLNIQGSELEALTHLEKAVKCATKDYRDNAPDETRSPVLTYYMLHPEASLREASRTTKVPVTTIRHWRTDPEFQETLAGMQEAHRRWGFQSIW